MSTDQPALAGPAGHLRALVRVTTILDGNAQKTVDTVRPMHRRDIGSFVEGALVRHTHRPASKHGLDVRNGRPTHNRTMASGDGAGRPARSLGVHATHVSPVERANAARVRAIPGVRSSVRAYGARWEDRRSPDPRYVHPVHEQGRKGHRP